MFLSAYHFDGPPASLLPAYQRLQAASPPESLELHVCVIRDGGLTIYDACPSRAVFEQFHRSTDFEAAVAGAGLPTPRVEPLGEVHTLRVREEARR
jgi:hypothetical protein